MTEISSFSGFQSREKQQEWRWVACSGVGSPDQTRAPLPHATAPAAQMFQGSGKSAVLCPHRYTWACQTAALGLGLEIKVTEAQDADSALPGVRFSLGHRAALGVLGAGDASRTGCWRQPPSPGLAPDHCCPAAGWLWVKD